LNSSSADKPEEQPHNNTETPCTTSEISKMASQAEQAEQPGFVRTDQLQAIITEAIHAALQTDWEAQEHQLDSENPVNRLCQDDLGFFDPYHEGDHDIEFAEKDTYYQNVHSFMKNAQNIADVKGANTVWARLHICLCGVAMKWYQTQLSDMKQTGLKEGNGINYWKKALINRFKESHSNALHTLQKTWYTLSDACNDRPSASYVYDVVCHIKSLDALTVQAQLTWAYNNLDSDLVRDINESTATTLIMQFIESMEEKRNAWKESLLKHQGKRQPDWGDQGRLLGWQGLYNSNNNCTKGNYFWWGVRADRYVPFWPFSYQPSPSQPFPYQPNTSYQFQNAYQPNQQNPPSRGNMSVLSSLRQSLQITSENNQEWQEPLKFDQRDNMQRSYREAYWGRYGEYNNQPQPAYQREEDQKAYSEKKEHAQYETEYEDQDVAWYNYNSYEEYQENSDNQKKNCKDENQKDNQVKAHHVALSSILVDLPMIMFKCWKCWAEFSSNNGLHTHIRKRKCTAPKPVKAYTVKPVESPIIITLTSTCSFMAL